MRNEFTLICMSFDGQYVTDSTHNTIEDAENASADIGSKWFFYPFHFIISGKTVKETGEGLINMATKKGYLEMMFKGKRLQTVVNAFIKANNYCTANEMEVDSLQFEEILIDQNYQRKPESIH